ncbi:MAG TPA: helical backbone metal receptor [Panacibacter sp.]|nr:helical backbone metal receptor [Panacibacter sp.]HNP43788.1 helical backbone metal receptor [Panacibacter sp.]
MFETEDQLKRKVVLQQFPPKRIVSLVPSITELLYDLGLQEEVIGITKFCVHPKDWFRSKTRVGGTKDINTAIVRSIKPDLIIANKEENVKEQVEALELFAPAWISDINTYEEALRMIKAVGELTGKDQKATQVINQIHAAFETLPWLVSPTALIEPATCCYLIWRNPYMTVGGDTFISNMLRQCGFRNAFENESRYPQVSLAAIASRRPQIVLLSSEPYPFKEKHIDEIHLALPNARILLVDGEMFSWYGSRMLYAAQYFIELREKIFTVSADGNPNFC